MNKTFKELLEQFEADTTQLEGAFEQLRGIPAGVGISMSSDVLEQFDDACESRTQGQMNLMALRA